MAVFQCNYRSKVQGRSVFFNVIIPEQCEDDIPVAYMLHGKDASYYDWLKALSIERYATARDIAIVMVDAGNSFYTDMKYGFKYYTFILEELMPYCQKMFHFSAKREKNFISGFSMGGYGCMRIGLKNTDKFAAIGAMSSTFKVDPNRPGADKLYFPIWGDDYKTVDQTSEGNIFMLVDEKKDDANKPWIYQCCGTEDGLITTNRDMKEFIKDKGFHYEYEEWTGAHQWDFWDEAIPKCLDFFQKYMHENNVEQYLNGRIPGSVVRRV